MADKSLDTKMAYLVLRYIEDNHPYAHIYKSIDNFIVTSDISKPYGSGHYTWQHSIQCKSPILIIDSKWIHKNSVSMNVRKYCKKIDLTNPNSMEMISQLLADPDGYFNCDDAVEYFRIHIP